MNGRALPGVITPTSLGVMTPRKLNRWTAPVVVSATYSCGCSQRPSEPVPAGEAASLPGMVIVCERHDEYAVVTRVTTRLVSTPDVLRALLMEADVDPVTAEAVADEQGRV